MRKHRFTNTTKNGSVRVLVFKEAGVWYGVALEFNIVESGSDPREVLFSLDEAIRGYIESAKKAKIRPFPLNQKPDKEYEKLWGQLENKKSFSVKSPYSVYYFGRQVIPA